MTCSYRCAFNEPAACRAAPIDQGQGFTVGGEQVDHDRIISQGAGWPYLRRPFFEGVESRGRRITANKANAYKKRGEKSGFWSRKPARRLAIGNFLHPTG
jgi:hypothetical protein